MGFFFFFNFVPSPGQQAVGVGAQRKGNPPDHRRRERQEAGGQTGQQLERSSGVQIKPSLPNAASVVTRPHRHR